MLWHLGYLLLWPWFKVLFRLSASGQECFKKLQGGAIIASNHKSYLDPIVLGLTTPRHIAFMAKSELFAYPIFGQLIKALYAFPVERGKVDKQALRYALEALKKNQFLGIFPEGTRIKKDLISPFMPGLALLVSLSNAPVIPAAIVGTDRVWRKWGLLPFFSKIRVVYGEPIFFSPNEEREVILKKIRESIVRLYEKGKEI